MIVDVAEGARRIARGDVVAYPTETVYGLGADATAASALADLRALKGRDAAQGLSVLVADAEDLADQVKTLADSARRLVARFWPGPLTLVLPDARAALSGVATARGVGFRCSPQPTAAALVRAARRPLVSTSCNRAGEPPAMTADAVGATFGDALPVVGGESCVGGVASTVVAVDAAGELELLREGALPFADVCKEARA